MAKRNPLTQAEALKQTNGNVSAAARLLGITRSTLQARVRDAGARRTKATSVVDAVAVADDVSDPRVRVKELEQKLAATQQLYAAVIDNKSQPRTILTHTGPRIRRAPRERLGAKHLLIPDVQAKGEATVNGEVVTAATPTNHLTAAGEYAAEKRPDVISIIGDFADVPSLSSYDKGKLQFEGRRYRTDIEVAQANMSALLAPIRRAKGYNPRIVLTMGNHENRIERTVEENSWLSGMIGSGDLKYAEMGVEVHPFLKPVVIDGIAYCHYFPRSASGAVGQTKRGAPNAKAQLMREGRSAIAGHQQGLDIHCQPLGGKLQWGIIAGSFYQHDEGYLSPQGNAHWRGVIMLHEVVDGYFNPMVVSLSYLVEKYG